MSKYEPLYDHLKPLRSRQLTMSFQEIERVLGSKLPMSAHRHQAWWANSTGKGHTQPACWFNAGWKTSKVDLENKCVTFVRRNEPIAHQRDGLPIDAVPAEIWSAIEGLTGISDRAEIVRRAMSQLLASLAASELISMGGSDKNASVPSRDRLSA